MLIRLFNQIFQYIINNKILKFLLIIFLIAYLFVFFYWYRYIETLAIGYHTNLIIPIYFIVIFDFLSKKTTKLSRIFSKGKFFSTIYFIVEAILVLINVFFLNNNTLYGQYVSFNDSRDENIYHTSKPYERLNTNTGQFVFKRQTNALGLSDKEWTKEKDEKTYRIICIGDSFTEGDGVDYEDSYPQVLQRLLNEKYKNIEVLNAGKRGSDPFFNFNHLSKVLIEYQPDMVIQSFTTNDYYFDFALRGGNERFVNDSTVKFRNHYWWESIYASSFTARILIRAIGGYDGFLINKRDYPAIMDDMYKKTIQLFKEYQKLSKSNHFKLIIFTMPFRFDYSNNLGVNKPTNNIFFKNLKIDFEQIGLPFYNIQPCYDEYFKSTKTSYKNYFWVKDGHHNVKGYEMMAHCIQEIIEPQININEQ
ncbi:MAG: GDSL-type esterase/lipase family protein [Chitinophagales bacterium]|nr:GDSL-type esterase/lipase family protein [Chitinophagales bacterium]